MANGIDIDKLGFEVMRSLQNYNTEVQKAVKLAVNKVARDTNTLITSTMKSYDSGSAFTIKRYVMIKINGHTKRVAIKTGRTTGRYVANFKVKTTENDNERYKRTWYVKKPMYPLTHLLEDGHKYNVNGKTGKTKAYPHVKYGEEYAQKELPLEIEKRIKKIK